MQALRDTLTRQIRLRFGSVDDAIDRRIAEANHAELERLIERIITAQDVDHLFAP